MKLLYGSLFGMNPESLKDILSADIWVFGGQLTDMM